MLIDRAEILTLIPHRGAMCLLDGVLAWDAASIVCTSMTHRDPGNPLRRRDRLAALAACEYGAQAMAVHGGLLARAAGRQAPPAYLAALRDARLYIDRLDTVEDLLTVSAERLLGNDPDNPGNAVYQCRVDAADRVLAQARITIITRPEFTL